MTEPTRSIINADALAWLAANTADLHASVVTSLPDVSELQLELDAWRAWFIAAARQVIAWTPRAQAAVFFQSDIRVGGAIVDKSYLVMRAA